MIGESIGAYDSAVRRATRERYGVEQTADSGGAHFCCDTLWSALLGLDALHRRLEASNSSRRVGALAGDAQAAVMLHQAITEQSFQGVTVSIGAVRIFHVL